MARALIVSAGTSSNEYLAQHAIAAGFPRPTIVPSCGEARRLLDSGSFSVVIVNMPLPDEPGHDFAIYAAQHSRAGVLVLVKAALSERVTQLVKQDGVMVLPKPFSEAAFMQGFHIADATSRRLDTLWQESEKLRYKLEQARVINRAKCRLIEQGMKEAEAHRHIEKLAMDTRRSRVEIAEDILMEIDRGDVGS